MPNYLLCDQLHVRISVLIYTFSVSSNVKDNSGSKVSKLNGT